MTQFRPMRRGKQQIPDDEAQGILRNATSGVLCVLGDDGYPYGVPLSYAYADGALYFHCAKDGHKLDAIRACPKASFTVIAQDDVRPATYTTHFRSVIAFGQVRIVENAAQKLQITRLLGERYNPGQPEATEAEIASGIDRMHILELRIEHLTGKEAIELARMR